MTNAMTKPARPVDTLRGLLEQSRGQIALALPKHLTPERMIRMALTVFNRNNALQSCSPVSILACVIQASELGLELSGPLGHAWMVPYKGTATFQIGYRGFFELAYRTGKVQCWPMRVVHANDVFEVEYGTDQKIIHKPALVERGQAIGYYSVIYLKDGSRDFEFMSVEDVEKHRDQFAKNKKPDSPWATNFDAMAMKTTVRRLAKRVPISTEIQKAVTFDEFAEQGLPNPWGPDMGHLAPPAPTRAEQVAQALANRSENGGGIPGLLASDEQRQEIDRLGIDLEWGGEQMAPLLAAAGVKDVVQMTSRQAEDVLSEMRRTWEERSQEAPGDNG